MDLIKKIKNLNLVNHPRFAIFLIVSCITLLSSALLVSDVFQKLELLTFDYRFKIRPQKPVDPRISLIVIADDSIRTFGRWPARNYLAAGMTILSHYDLAMLGYDILFFEKSSEQEDIAFIQSVGLFNNAYFPYVFEYVGESAKNILYPIEQLQNEARGMGHINVFLDSDGKLRHVPLYIKYNNQLYPQLSFKMACDYLNVKDDKIEIVPGKHVKIYESSIGPITIPIDKNYRALINWAGKWDSTFARISFIDIIASYRQIQDGSSPRIDLTTFKGKITFIGVSAIGLSDIRATPLEPGIPAVSIHANLVNSMLHKDFLSEAGLFMNLAILIFIGLVMAIIMHQLKPVRDAVLACLFIGAYVTCVFLVFIYGRLFIKLTYPVFNILICYFSVTIYNQVIIAMERTKLYNLATRDGLTGLFVIRHFNLLFDTEFAGSKERNADMSIIMSDIDHFKDFNDTYGHQVGDFVLKETARLFRSVCRPLDIPGRYGGEEFIMLLPGFKQAEAAAVAEKIRKAVELHIYKDVRQEYRVNISLGVASISKDIATKEELTKKADDALYKAKHLGRNRVCVAE